MSTLKHAPSKAAGKRGLSPEDASAGTASGPWIDRTGFQSAKLTGILGAISGSPSAASATFNLQDASDDSGTGAADFGDALTALDSADSVANGNFDLSGAKQFVRVQCDVAFTGGSSPSALIAAALTLMGAVEPPTSD